MSPDAHTPAERADAVLRAAEAAAAAAQAAAEEPAGPEPPAAEPAGPEPRVAEEGLTADAQAALAHEAGAPARLLAAAADLEAHVEQAQTQLGALEEALERLARSIDQAH